MNVGCATVARGLSGTNMATTWSDADVFKLIELWGEQGIQEQLEGSKRNKHVYARLSSELAKQGIEKSGEQCRCKVKKLRQEYKKIKDAHNETGTERKKWKLYDSLNEILGNPPATRPPVVLDTTDDQTLAGEETGEMSDLEEDGAENESRLGNVEDDNTSALVEATDIETGSRSRSSTVNIQKGKKRKRSKGEVIEDVMSKVMKSVTESLKESDRMFVELEEKRMKFEEQQKKEERQFQLQMMQILVGSSNPLSHPADPHAYFPTYPPYAPQHSHYYSGIEDPEDC